MSSAQTSSNMYRVQACWRRGSCLTGGLSKKRRTGSGFCVGAARTEVNNTVLESSAKSPNCYIEFTRCGRASNQLQAKRTGRQRRKGRAVSSALPSQLREIFPSCSHGVTDGAFFPWSWEERSTFLATGRRLCIHSEEACNKIFIFLPEIIKQRRIWSQCMHLNQSQRELQI